MKPKTLILMVVAVSCGLGASYMTSRLLADRGENVERVTILIAKKNLNMGDILKSPEDMFEEKSLPKGEEPRLAITDPAQLKGRALKRSLRAGDFVTPEDLHDEKSHVGNIIANLPPGQVAVGIRVNPESIAGGFASLPGARVNVMLTVRKSDDKGSYSKILLENVLVLAADTQTVRTENGGAMPANVVTVALKFDDSLRLELAKQVGTISLALRKFNDQTMAQKDKLTVEGLLGNSADQANVEPSTAEVAVQTPLAQKPVTPKEPTPSAAPKSPYTIVIREGSRIRTAVVEDGGEGATSQDAPELQEDPAGSAPAAVAPKKNEKP